MNTNPAEVEPDDEPEDEPKSLEQLRFEARMDPENQPFRPCSWSEL